jgi:hypothetical protein
VKIGLEKLYFWVNQVAELVNEKGKLTEVKDS